MVRVIVKFKAMVMVMVKTYGYGFMFGYCHILIDILIFIYIAYHNCQDYLNNPFTSCHDVNISDTTNCAIPKP